MFLVEFIVTPDLLEGPRAALLDAFRLFNGVAAYRAGEGGPLAGWRNWHPGGRIDECWPEEAGHRALPDAAVFGGWVAAGGARLNELAHRDRAAAERLHEVHAANRPVVAFHTGVALLGLAGLLEGREVSVPWPYLGSMMSLEPRLHLANDRAWSVTGGVWTIPRPASATEVAFELLAHGGMADRARAVQEVLLLDEDRQRTLGNLASRLKPRTPVGQIERARRHIEEHFHETVALEAVAAAASMSVRTLQRQFRLHFGVTPVQMVHRLRIATVRMLLQTTHYQMDHISELSGWKSTAMMRKIFKQEAGIAPEEFRRRFGLMPERTAQGRR